MKSKIKQNLTNLKRWGKEVALSKLFFIPLQKKYLKGLTLWSPIQSRNMARIICCYEDLLDHLTYETWKEVTTNKLAIFAFHVCKFVVQVAAVEVPVNDLLRVRPPEAVLPGVMVVIDLDVKRNNG